jgi:CheY-like chemotaxis protein
LRDFGDTLFGLTDHPAVERGTPPVGWGLTGRRVMLLLDSPFRQSQLCERLREAGCVVETAGDPGGLLARVGDPLPPEILLCDNLEPSLHLTAVREKLQALAPTGLPPLILVATSGGSPSMLRDRAKHLGAQGTWADPFRPADLAAALV